MKIGLFDYGAGNLHSLAKALEAGGASVTVTDDWETALGGDALVLPGVGSFGAAVRSLKGRAEDIRRRLQEGHRCLGICLGMQLLFDASEEGEGKGIGLIPGTVRRLEARVVPQMGWNEVMTGPDPIFGGVERLVAYYANSYVCEPKEPGVSIASTEYEGRPFVAGVRKGNTWGLQFHPEKSSGPGLRIIRNFLEGVE